MTTETTLKLQRYFRSVNNKHFRGEIALTAVRFGIPDAVPCSGELRVPAAAYSRDSKEIVVHEALPQMNCPRYVYMYLLYHECLHVSLPVVKGVMHSDEFRRRENFAPHRSKATRWLDKRRFPVMQALRV